MEEKSQVIKGLFSIQKPSKHTKTFHYYVLPCLGVIKDSQADFIYKHKIMEGLWKERKEFEIW